jgi:HAE1 family hydrophobic/amphiphilic exporter-1
MGMAVFSGMLVATFLGVLLIPMLYVMVEKVVGARAPKPAVAPTPPKLAAEHGHGGGH